MPGTKIGGIKARETNIKKYGREFYRTIGSKGGQNGHTGGFAANPALARVAGAKGGKISRRGPEGTQKEKREFVWKGGPDAKLVFKEEK